MSKQVQFKISVIAATISMMMAGSAFAAGNTLVGPNVDAPTAAATVKIEQSGTDNVTSTSGLSDGGAFVFDETTGTSAALTIQQVGTGNTLKLNSYTNADTIIQVYQGFDGTADSTGAKSGDTTANNVTGNTADIAIGTGTGNRALATNVLVSQQTNYNTATVAIASSFAGTLNLVQTGTVGNASGTGSSANLTLGASTGNTFNIGQSGPGNTLVLTAGNVTGGVTANFGDVSFVDLGTKANPVGTDVTGGNNAGTYLWSADAGVTGVASSTNAGIHLGDTLGFNLSALGGSNKVQVDLATAGTASKMDVALAGTNKLAVYGKDGATVNIGDDNQVSLTSSKTLAVFTDAITNTGSGVNLNRLQFNGNGYFSNSAGSVTTLKGGTVDAGGASVLLAKSGSSFSAIDSNNTAHWVLNVNDQYAASTVLVTTEKGGTYNLTQTTANSGSGHAMTLDDNSATTGGNWTVSQTGAGAKTLNFTNSTPSATITATQTGANTQSATGIDFAAASGSFTLVQR